MGVLSWRQRLIAVIACGALLSPGVAFAQGIRHQATYQYGYQQGFEHGNFDARTGASFNPGHDPVLRGPRNDAFRHGYVDGYRDGFGRFSVVGRPRGRAVGQNRGLGPVAPRGVIDPYARGYDRGFEVGFKDGRDGDRYDPVRDRGYRDADDGYSNGYGSRDAYRNNYRAGFRQGYEEGYRQGSRNRRR